MTFFILPLWSARDLDIGPEGFSPRDDISRELMTRAIWKRPCINLFITYFARADNMLFPSKNVIARRQITRHKLCFYYKCKFGVISINYVIINNNNIFFFFSLEYIYLLCDNKLTFPTYVWENENTYNNPKYK